LYLGSGSAKSRNGPWVDKILTAWFEGGYDKKIEMDGGGMVKTASLSAVTVSHS
jgi:hypothetical protein